MSEVKIKKIEIKIGEKTIELSLEQARELKGALNDLFPIYQPWYLNDWHWSCTTGDTEPKHGTISLSISAT